MTKQKLSSESSWLAPMHALNSISEETMRKIAQSVLLLLAFPPLPRTTALMSALAL